MERWGARGLGVEVGQTGEGRGGRGGPGLVTCLSVPTAGRASVSARHPPQEAGVALVASPPPPELQCPHPARVPTTAGHLVAQGVFLNTALACPLLARALLRPHNAQGHPLGPLSVTHPAATSGQSLRVPPGSSLQIPGWDRVVPALPPCPAPVTLGPSWSCPRGVRGHVSASPTCQPLSYKGGQRAPSARATPRGHPTGSQGLQSACVPL